MHTFSFPGDYSIPKSVKCTHSATKVWGVAEGTYLEKGEGHYSASLSGVKGFRGRT